MTDGSKERCAELAHGILARYPAGSSDTIYREVSELITALRARVEELEGEPGTLQDWKDRAQGAESSLAEALEVVRGLMECVDYPAPGAPGEASVTKRINRAKAFEAKHGGSDDK